MTRNLLLSSQMGKNFSGNVRRHCCKYESRVWNFWMWDGRSCRVRVSRGCATWLNKWGTKANTISSHVQEGWTNLGVGNFVMCTPSFPLVSFHRCLWEFHADVVRRIDFHTECEHMLEARMEEDVRREISRSSFGEVDWWVSGLNANVLCFLFRLREPWASRQQFPVLQGIRFDVGTHISHRCSFCFLVWHLNAVFSHSLHHHQSV